MATIIVNSNTSTTGTVTWPTVSHFMDADEIVTDIPSQLAPSDVAYFTDIAMNKLLPDGSVDVSKCTAGERFGISFSIMNLGMWIRNTYNLWHPHNPHTMLKHVPDLQNGVDVSPYHPDNFSGAVVTKLFDNFRSNSPEQQMIAQLKKLGLTP